MIEIIRQVPGPLFLLYYAAYAAACMVVGRILLSADGTLNYPMPDLTRFDPLSLSFLRGGRAAVIRTAVFDLWHKGLVTIGGTGADVTLGQARVGNKELSAKMKNVKPVARLIYQFLEVKRKSADLFRAKDMKAGLDMHLRLTERELTEERLMKTEHDLTRSMVVSAILVLVMLLPGVIKLGLGISRLKPVGFLFIILVASVLVFGFSLRPWSKATGLGRKYLARLEKDFGWIKEKTKKKGLLTGIDPAFAVALFGPAVLGAETGYQAYASAFHKSGGYSCGGCSGSSSCGGGGGCGGSGCGGGGCGGCGG